MLTIILASRYALQPGLALDLKPAGNWPEPEIPPDEPFVEAPVLVTVEYEIDPAQTDEFVSEMRKMEQVRRRNARCGVACSPMPRAQADNLRNSW